MKQKLDSIINKGKILALASLASLAINCQSLKPDIESEVEVFQVSKEQTYNPCVSDGDENSIWPCGVIWTGPDGYGGTCWGVGTWCPPGEFCHEDPYNPGTFKCYPDIIMHKVSD